MPIVKIAFTEDLWTGYSHQSDAKVGDIVVFTDDEHDGRGALAEVISIAGATLFVERFDPRDAFDDASAAMRIPVHFTKVGLVRAVKEGR